MTIDGKPSIKSGVSGPGSMVRGRGDPGRRMSELNVEVNTLLNQIDHVFLQSHQDVTGIIAEAQKMDLLTAKGFDHELQKSNSKLQKGVAVASLMRNHHDELENEFRSKRKKLESDLKDLVGSFDEEMIARQELLDQLREDETLNFLEIENLELELRRVEKLRDEMEDEMKGREKLQRLKSGKSVSTQSRKSRKSRKSKKSRKKKVTWKKGTSKSGKIKGSRKGHKKGSSKRSIKRGRSSKLDPSRTASDLPESDQLISGPSQTNSIIRVINPDQSSTVGTTTQGKIPPEKAKRKLPSKKRSKKKEKKRTKRKRSKSRKRRSKKTRSKKRSTKKKKGRSKKTSPIKSIKTVSGALDSSEVKSTSEITEKSASASGVLDKTSSSVASSELKVKGIRESKRRGGKKKKSGEENEELPTEASGSLQNLDLHLDIIELGLDTELEESSGQEEGGIEIEGDPEDVKGMQTEIKIRKKRVKKRRKKVGGSVKGKSKSTSKSGGKKRSKPKKKKPQTKSKP